jgi:hypothetical protein
MPEDDLVRQIKFGWLSLALILVAISASLTLNAAPTPKTAIILAAFGTTNAYPTYDKIDKQVKERLSGL